MIDHSIFEFDKRIHNRTSKANSVSKMTEFYPLFHKESKITDF